MLSALVCLLVCCAVTCPAQTPPNLSDTAQVAPPPLRRAEPPSPSMTVEELEQKGDELRALKYNLDAMDYFHAALAKSPNNARILNKMGMVQLLSHHLPEAKKYLEHAIKADHNFANAYNNLGVVHYMDKRYGKAIKEYEKAIEVEGGSASYYSNMGAAYFADHKFEKAIAAYSKAVELDPDVFERSSRTGVTAQTTRPEDRAHYEYVMAKLYAKMGASDRALQALRKAMEEGYKDIANVYKDAEFGELRKDPRFVALMADKPVAIRD
jgi:tetratricopeptide (TPR) repeat protein